MSGLPDQFVNVFNEDRFCTECGGSLQGCAIVREAHYDMHIVRCPTCDHLAHIERRPLTRTGQRWAGLAVAFWLLGLLALWMGTNASMYGITVGIIEEVKWELAGRIRQIYEGWSPDDAGGTFETSVQIVRTGPPPSPSSPASPGQGVSGTAGAAQNPNVQVFPAGPGQQVVVTQQDDELRNRFGRWWAQQDPKSILEQAGGYGAAADWRTMWPWLLLGLIPMCFGIAWSVMLLNVSRPRMFLAWPIVGVWYLLAAAITLSLWGMFPVASPNMAAASLLAPMLMLVFGGWFMGALLLGLLTGRSITRGMVRLALSPRAGSALALLWSADGKPPPRVSATAT